MATADVATAAYDTTSDMTAAAVRLVFFKKEGNKDNGGYTNITQAICSTYSRSQPHHNHTCVAKEKKATCMAGWMGRLSRNECIGAMPRH